MTVDTIQKQDEDNLRSLAIGFRVVGGLCALCVNFAWLHVIVGFVTMIGGNIPVKSTSQSGAQSTAMTGVLSTTFGGVFVIVGLVAIIGGYVMGYFGFKAAKALETRKNWKLCFGTSIGFMLFQPLGLILGMFAMIVLHRPTVRGSFDLP